MTFWKVVSSIVLVVGSIPTAQGSVFDTALVHYQFDQAQLDSNLFVDLQGNVDLRHTNTNSFPTISPGPANAGGDAITFANGRVLAPVTAGSDSILNLTSSMNSALSLAMWVKRPDNGDDFIISKMDSNTNFRGWWFIVEDDGKLAVIIRNSNTGDDRLWYRTSEPVILDGDPEFHHVALTYDFVDSSIDPNRGIKIYLDGASQNLTIDPNTNGVNFNTNDYDLSSSNPFTVNGRNAVGTLGSNGTIADLAIWGEAISALDIASLAGIEGLPGDFDLDGNVDGRDFLLWQRGETSPPLSADSLAEWQTNYGLPSQNNLTAAVPEPNSILTIVIGLVVTSLIVNRRV
jgi:hypothetical protein